MKLFLSFIQVASIIYQHLKDKKLGSCIYESNRVWIYRLGSVIQPQSQYFKEMFHWPNVTDDWLPDLEYESIPEMSRQHCSPIVYTA